MKHIDSVEADDDEVIVTYVDESTQTFTIKEAMCLLSEYRSALQASSDLLTNMVGKSDIVIPFTYGGMPSNIFVEGATAENVLLQSDVSLLSEVVGDA